MAMAAPIRMDENQMGKIPANYTQFAQYLGNGRDTMITPYSTYYQQYQLGDGYYMPVHQGQQSFQQPWQQGPVVNQGMRSLSQIQRGDAATAPIEPDFRRWAQRIVELFLDQPRVGELIAPDFQDLLWDGTTEWSTPTVEKVPRPEYSMRPGRYDVNVQGGEITVKTPQIYVSVELTLEEWVKTFAGEERIPLIVRQYLDEFKNEEDRILFQGRSGIDGIISSQTHDLGDPDGPWGDDADADGLLENALAAIRAGLTHFTSEAVPTMMAVDVVFTSYLYNLLATTPPSYDPSKTNLDVIGAMLRGGNIYATDNLQDYEKDPVAEDNNTMLMAVRTTSARPSFQVLASDMKQEMLRVRGFKQALEMNEKYSINILEGERYIAYMDDIDAGTT